VKCNYYKICSIGAMSYRLCNEKAVQCWRTSNGTLFVCQHHIENFLHWNMSGYAGTNFSTRMSPEEEMVCLVHEE
jgi:hypothetical protein